MVIALITISGGMIAEGKLDRAFRRMNADNNTPIGTKDKTLAQMAKDGYITRVKEATNGDETIDYIVGPRGKVEVGREGFAKFVRTIYGQDGDDEDLEKSIERTLNVADASNGSVLMSAVLTYRPTT
jgi:melanoma-associated antigen